MKIINYHEPIKITFFMIAVFISIYIVDMTHAANKVYESTKSKQGAVIYPPENVIRAINTVCPTCKIITLNDLADEARDEFLEMYHSANPGWIAGDFNGDGLVDYALLLSNRIKGKNYLRLVALIASTATIFNAKILIDKYEGHSLWYIGLMPAGTVAKHTQAFAPKKNELSEVKLTNPDIEYFKAGSSMSVFYFDKGAFHVIPVSY